MAHPHCWNYIDILSENSYNVNTVKLKEEMRPEINEIGLAALLSLPTAGIPILLHSFSLHQTNITLISS